MDRIAEAPLTDSNVYIHSILPALQGVLFICDERHEDVVHFWERK